MKMITKSMLLIAITFFSFQTLKAQTKSSKTDENKKAKITCIMCKGTGSGEGIPLTCMNCIKWSNEYKRKVACHVCKDTRVVYKEKCELCKGTGKIDKVEFENLIKDGISVSKNTNVYVPPISDKPMTDAEYEKFYNANADPSLQSTSASSQYPVRPVQSNVKYVEIIADNSKKIKEQEDAKRLLEENIIKKKEIDVINKKILELKSFFGTNNFDVIADPMNSNSIKITKLSSDKSITLSSYKIQDGFVIDNDNRSVYNKEGDLVYKGNADYRTFQFIKENGEKLSYLFYHFYIESESAYRYIIGNYKGEIILNQLDNDKVKLYLVSSSNELEEFDFNKYKNHRLLVTRFYSSTTNDLANIQYEYQIIDLENGTKSKMVNEQNLRRNINKLQKKESSMIDSFKSAVN